MPALTCAGIPRAAPRFLPHLRGGYSLIELVMVVAIIGIIAAIAMPRFGNSIARYRLESAAKRLSADLRLMRDHATLRSQASEMVFVTGASSGYTVTGLRHLDRIGTMKYEVVLSSAPYGVSLTSVNVGGDDRIAFDGFGIPDSAGSITVRAGSYTMTVVVDATTGNIQISAP